MKKLLAILLVLAGIAGCACAQEALPQAVLDLCASVHPGYEIAAYDGWGDENRGQFALILKLRDDNILCMAEKEVEEPAYQMTMDNRNAVYAGNILPSLHIDSGGDTLFYIYQDVNGRASEHYHTNKEMGDWSTVDVTVYLREGDRYYSILSFVSGGELRYQHYEEDENGNIIRSWEDAPLAVSDEFERSMLPQHFDIDVFDADPTDGLYLLTKNDAFTRLQEQQGETLENLDISRVHAAKLYRTEDGSSMLYIDEWNGVNAERAALLRFAGDVGMDTYHAGDGDVFVSTGVMMYSIERADAGSWYVHGVDDSGMRTIGPDYAEPDGQTTVYRNDGYVYGKSPWGVLSGQAVTLAESYEKMIAQMDPDAYALVNNPNPEDRLHLRAKPDKSAHSYGKFYNRTPVLVLERGSTWTKVQIGRGGAAMTGYMMTKFLAFDENEKAKLACAFPQMHLKEEYRSSGLSMYAEPRGSAVTDRLFKQESNDFIIGVSGDEWYIVLRADGAVGYVPQGAFWAGNG